MQLDDHISFVKNDQQKSCGEVRVLVGVTGSVAALKLPLLVSQLRLLPGVSCFMFIIFMRILLLIDDTSVCLRVTYTLTFFWLVNLHRIVSVLGTVSSSP